jgi:hypothetical protein
MNNESRILIEFGAYAQALLDEYLGTPAEDFKRPSALMTVLHIERILDSGRVLLHDPESETISLINKQLDSIRARVPELIRRVGFSETIAMLQHEEAEARLYVQTFEKASSKED